MNFCKQMKDDQEMTTTGKVVLDFNELDEVNITELIESFKGVEQQ